MGLGVELSCTVSIQNKRLAVIYYSLNLLIVGWCIRSWFAERGGTVELPATSQVSFNFYRSSTDALKYNVSRDAFCKDGRMYQRMENGIIKRFVCARLVPYCPTRVPDLDLCADELEAKNFNSPFDFQFRVLETSKTVAEGRASIATYRFFAFTQIYALNLTYQFNVGMTVPRSFGLNGNLLESGTNKDAKTVLLDADGLPAQTYEPGEDILLQLPRLLQLMQSPTGNDWSEIFHGSNGSLPGNDVTFPSWIWGNGCTLYVKVSCFSDDYDIKRALSSRVAHPSQRFNESLWEMGASPTMLVCFVNIELAHPNSVRALLIERKRGLTRSRLMMNIHIIGKTGSGFVRAFDIQAAVLFVTSALVLIGLPKCFIRFFTLKCLGQLSAIYRDVVAPRFDVNNVCARVVMQLVSQSVNFVELADATSLDGVLYGGVSWRRMLERVSAIVRHRSAELDVREVQVLADFAFSQAMQRSQRPPTMQLLQRSAKRLLDLFKFRSLVTGGGSAEDQSNIKEATLDIDNFCHATGSEAISIDTIAKLFDRDRRPSILERLFFPQNLWRCVHESRASCVVHAEQEKDITDKSEDERQELPVAAVSVEVDSLPLESRKEAVAKSASERGRVNAFSTQDVTSVKEELTNMRRRIDDLQAALLRESEKRSAAEAALRSELSRSMQDVQSAVAGIRATDVERQQEVEVVLNVCEEVREYGAKLQQVTASRTNQSSHKVTMAGPATDSLETAKVAENADAALSMSLPVFAWEEQFVAQGLNSEALWQMDVAGGQLQQVKRAHGSSKCPLRTALGLHKALQKLASSHSHLLQMMADQTSRIESVERRIDAEPWKAISATEDQRSREGHRSQSISSLLRETGVPTRARAAVVQSATADPPVRAAAPESNIVGHHSPKAKQLAVVHKKSSVVSLG